MSKCGISVVLNSLCQLKRGARKSWRNIGNSQNCFTQQECKLRERLRMCVCVCVRKRKRERERERERERMLWNEEFNILDMPES